MARLNFLWAIIGTNRTGKTTEALKLAKAWKKDRPYGKVIVFDPQYKFRQAKVADYYITGEEDDWAKILIQEKGKDKNGKPLFKFQNSLLILDDYKAILDSNTLPKSFLKLLGLRMEISMDIIYITWNPRLILERLSYFTNHFSIFYTESDSSDFSDKVANYTLCQRAANVINKYVFAFGRGRYKDDKGNVVAEFPHAYVQTENNEVELLNVDPNKWALLEANGMDEVKTKLEFRQRLPEEYTKAFPSEAPQVIKIAKPLSSVTTTNATKK